MRTRDIDRAFRKIEYLHGKIRDNLIDTYEQLTSNDEDCSNICPGNGLNLGPLETCPCEMCYAFPELRGKPVNHIDGGGHRKCPCYVFGREEATKRLKKLLDRIEKEGMVPNEH